MINDRKGFEKKPKGHVNKTSTVGAQGTGGPKGAGKVDMVSNPRGIEPKKVGGGRMPLHQGPVQPKVGK